MLYVSAERESQRENERLLVVARWRLRMSKAADLPCTCRCLTGLAEVKTDLLECLGERFCQLLGRHGASV